MGQIFSLETDLVIVLLRHSEAVIALEMRMKQYRAISHHVLSMGNGQAGRPGLTVHRPVAPVRKQGTGPALSQSLHMEGMIALESFPKQHHVKYLNALLMVDGLTGALGLLVQLHVGLKLIK